MLLLDAAPVYDCWFLYRSQLGSFGSNGRSTISSQHNYPHCIVTDRSGRCYEPHVGSREKCTSIVPGSLASVPRNSSANLRDDDDAIDHQDRTA